MKLKELKLVLGVPVEELKTGFERTRRRVFLIYLLDAALILGLTAVMFFNNAQPAWYGVALVVVLTFVNLLFQMKTGGPASRVYNFYKRYANSPVVIKNFNITDANADDALCECGCPPGDFEGVDEFKRIVTDFVKGNIVNAVMVSSGIMRYETPTGQLRAYILETSYKFRKHQYFIGFVDDGIIKEEVNV